MSNNEPAAKPTPERLSELAQIADRAIQNFQGNGKELQSAIGMLFVGEHYGWKVLYLIHDRKTVRKYQKILDIDAREEFPEVGNRAHKSVGFVAVQKISNFWKAVRGEIKNVKTPELK